MTESNVISRTPFEVSQNLSSVFDFAVTEKPVFVRHSHDDIVILSTQMLQCFLKPLKFNVSFFEEDDSSFTGTLEELDLIENAPSKEDCIVSLLKAMKEYAHDFYNDFSLWSSAPNRKNHIPYVLKILSGSDDELMGDIICQNGKI